MSACMSMTQFQLVLLYILTNLVIIVTIYFLRNTIYLANYFAFVHYEQTNSYHLCYTLLNCYIIIIFGDHIEIIVFSLLFFYSF